MKTEIDLHNWNRKEHYQFFKNFHLPFHGVTVSINCTSLYRQSKLEESSFFLNYLFTILQAVNEIENFKLRIEHDKVYKYDKINVSPTIGRNDKTFAFSFIEFDEQREVFFDRSHKAIQEVNTSEGLGLNASTARKDVIHFSALPWIQFSSVTHASMLHANDSVPKISVGKISFDDDQCFLPVSIHVHHALADGYHLGLLIQSIQEKWNH